ncbi:MAG: hypothetical protein AAGF87_15360, partial [Bacteroidota bacterium]
SANINELGFGNDLGENEFVTTITNVPVNTNWRKYHIPIPDPSKLTRESGMLWFAEGPEDNEGYTFWIDEVRFEDLGTVTPISADIVYNGGNDVVNAENGAIFEAEGTSQFNLPNGVDIDVVTSPAYFDFVSSNTDVATVDGSGDVTVVGEGEAVVSASFRGEEVEGNLTITSSGVAAVPAEPAPTPTQPEQDVISIYSNAYTNEPIDFLNGFWIGSTTQSEELQIAGDDLVRYSNLNFVGIQFTTPTIDMSAMTHFRMDIWTPEPTSSGVFRVKLVDFGPNNQFDGGGDDSEHELTITAPTLQSQQWVSLDIPFSQFPGLTSRANLAQVVLSGDIPTVFADNVYFYRGEDNGGGGDDEPTMAAPTPPTRDAEDVISLFSDAYDDVFVETFRTDWSQAGLEEVSIAGNPVKKYTAVAFVGIETMMAGNQIDITDMTHVHVDVWSPDFEFFAFKLVDAGPNGTIDGDGSDDVEDEIQYTTPNQGEWIQYDIPLADFAALTTREQIAQYIFSAQPTNEATLYIDNIYFYREGDGGGGLDEPTDAAPTPNRPAANVISLFSDAYDDVAVDTWRTEWSMANFEDVIIAGNAVKKYTDLDFVGIETTASPLDVSGMTHVHVDVWSPDFEFFAFKLVDAGANGTIDGPDSDDVEHEIQYDLPQQGQWLSYDIPLADFGGLVTQENIAQYIFVGRPSGASTVFLDNIYFYSE